MGASTSFYTYVRPIPGQSRLIDFHMEQKQRYAYAHQPPNSIRALWGDEYTLLGMNFSEDADGEVIRTYSSLNRFPLLGSFSISWKGESEYIRLIPWAEEHKCYRLMEHKEPETTSRIQIKKRSYCSDYQVNKPQIILMMSFLNDLTNLYSLYEVDAGILNGSRIEHISSQELLFNRWSGVLEHLSITCPESNSEKYAKDLNLKYLKRTKGLSSKLKNVIMNQGMKEFPHEESDGRIYWHLLYDDINGVIQLKSENCDLNKRN